MLESATAVARISFFVLYSVLKVRSSPTKGNRSAGRPEGQLLPFARISSRSGCMGRVVTLPGADVPVNLWLRGSAHSLGATSENLGAAQVTVQIGLVCHPSHNAW